ncbi:hypothetical protein PPYR_11553 [Photinus pyralis]|uniref:tRNA (uracil-O(2)-)-methyltransferase n=2 Tax=Photinus pyralis TaxID=7054 RepID=A0A5N4ABM2_PHOPY|nr:probable tRNA (uracil-O(2)-)-methyltransferase [Photinus pyralis]XP_031351755.1 probable tRNA (uracil-O(2)-)-methyltransferase [Photinus pyralis]KAB0794714.1 hypothetical protein PPYR_11553 [Photinus pyralis]
MLNVPLASSDSEASEDQFWSAVLLYHNRPHLVNRRLLGVSQALFVKLSFSNLSVRNVCELFTRSAILYEARKLPRLLKEFISVDFVKNILEPFDKNVSFEDCSERDFLTKEDGTFVSLRILLARQVSVDNCLEVVVFDKRVKTATFIAVSEFDRRELAPSFLYQLALSSGYLSLYLQSFEDAESRSAEWLTEQLFLKLMKWIDEYNPNVNVQQSLSLVPVEAFTSLYHNLKAKYGRKIVKEWPENTDPHKFVYEDLAIAAYLITLWNTIDANKKPQFVDLGCGNGLLTFILTKEGYGGTGIDVRRRKIWDTFEGVDLKEEVISPSAACLFPHADWIIGNHSDELTPWIPVIAARSSYGCNLFLLPCCAYDFNGKKYRRRNTGVSVYCDYLEYVKSICVTCGFSIAVDKLRIPSTKRTCFVSFGRTYCETEMADADRHVQAMIGQGSVESCWNEEFVAREPKERVRNCTQLDRGVIADIIKKITLLLLEQPENLKRYDGCTWNRGSRAPLSLVAKSLGKEDLGQLKNECGGLKTLLRNHRYIFEVAEGWVCLRLPPTAVLTNLKYKEKLCWFNGNHPDGCFHSSEVCAYRH